MDWMEFNKIVQGESRLSLNFAGESNPGPLAQSTPRLGRVSSGQSGPHYLDLR